MPDQQDKDHDQYFSTKHDIYRDKKSGILRNIPNLKTEDELTRFEEILFQANFTEATDFIKNSDLINLDAWKSVHKICFSDVYHWAGELRTIRIAKDTTIFAYPETIETEASKLFNNIHLDFQNQNLTLEKIAIYFAEVNVIHPFREGNGRTQRIIFNEIFERSGYRIDYDLTNQTEMIQAMISGYKGDYNPVIKLFKKISLPFAGEE